MQPAPYRMGHMRWPESWSLAVSHCPVATGW
jgi:hypothetical protein